MKKFIQLLILFAFLNSCTSTKNYANRKDADNTLQDVVQNLNKNANNQSARKALPGLYADVQHLHLSNIKKFNAENKDGSPRWNDIILEYQALQNAYNLITNSVVANLVAATSYESNIRETKEAAGKHLYQLAESLLRKDGRKNAQQALAYFKVCNYYVPGYEKVKSMISTAYERAVINVIIDSLNDNDYFINSNLGKKGYYLYNEVFQENLKTDLQDDFLNSKYPVAFYAKNEANQNNIRIDWILDLKLLRMDINGSTGNVPDQPLPPLGSRENNLVTYIRPGSGIISGPDPQPAATFGADAVFNYPQPIAAVSYRNYNYTIDNSSAKGILLMNIKDEKTLEDISLKILKAKYHLQYTNNRYANDNRKLTQHLSSYNASEQHLYILIQNLYDKIYPQIKNNINEALN